MKGAGLVIGRLRGTVAGYVLGRIGQAVLVLWAAYTVSFVVLYLLPSDPVGLLLAAGNVQVQEVDPAQLAALKAQYGLDQPVVVQYLTQLWHVLHLDFGASISKNLPVAEVLAQRLPATAVLGASAVALTLVLGVGVAYLASSVHTPWLRVFLSRLPSAGVALPPFFVGLVLIQVFAFSLRWFPATGTAGWRSLVLPAITMALPTSAMLAQVLLKSLDDTWRLPYIVTARAKGLAPWLIQARHAFRNAALPALTILGLLAGATVTNAVIAETVFSRDGVGRLAQEAVLAQDVPLVQAIVIVAAAVFVLVNLVVDLIYPLLDPRVATTAAVT